jgi:hypothetical protein
MPLQNPSKPLRAAEPRREIFDPWNSISHGHQHAENRLSGSASWRDSRHAKLAEQYANGSSGGRRTSDTVEAGSENSRKGGRTKNGSWLEGASALRGKNQKTILECMGGSRKQRSIGDFLHTANNHKETEQPSAVTGLAIEEREEQVEIVCEEQDEKEQSFCGERKQKQAKTKAIFHNVCVYINGSTMPLVSDHKLKQLLTKHGARVSLALGRRSVTHVILGTTSTNGWCGGGLSGSKLQREIASARGKAIRYVSAEWALESIRAGIRQPEGRFQVLKIASSNQREIFASTGSK